MIKITFLMLMSTFVEKFVIASPLENASFEYLPSILLQRKQRQEGLETSFESRQNLDIERNGTVADHQFRLGIINCVWDQCW